MHETVFKKKRRREEEGKEEEGRKVVIVIVVKSLKTGVHIKGGGFHTLKLHLMIGFRRPWWQQHAALPGPLPIGSGGNSLPPALAALSLESWQFCLHTEMQILEP